MLRLNQGMAGPGEAKAGAAIVFRGLRSSKRLRQPAVLRLKQLERPLEQPHLLRQGLRAPAKAADAVASCIMLRRRLLGLTRQPLAPPGAQA